MSKTISAWATETLSVGATAIFCNPDFYEDDVFKSDDLIKTQPKPRRIIPRSKFPTQLFLEQNSQAALGHLAVKNGTQSDESTGRDFPYSGLKTDLKRTTQTERPDLKARLSFIKSEAEADGDVFNEDSANSLILFVASHLLPYPMIALTERGNLRAIWKSNDCGLEIDFLADGLARATISLYDNRDQPGRYAAYDKLEAISERWIDVISTIRSSR